MRTIEFYKDISGNCPIIEFLDSLQPKQAQKVTWVLQLIEEHDNVPTTYFKHLTNSDGIWEVRVQQGNNIFRLLGFKHEERIVLLTNGFVKKTQKTPKNEIELAQKRKADWIARNDHE